MINLIFTGFQVLSDAERTAALYSLLQYFTQVQIRFFITVLKKMMRADPMTSLLSANARGSMQGQMEAKVAQLVLKSPDLRFKLPPSPSACNFSGNIPRNRQPLVVESQSSSFLSPGSAVATLAQQGVKLKANAAYRISAPALTGGHNVWGGSGANALGQVAERSSDSEGQELTIPALSSNGARPKSTDFSGLLPSPRLSTAAAESDVLEPQLSPMVGGNWASMVNTPRDFMFDVPQGGGQNLDAAATKLATWQAGTGNSGGRFSLDDAKKFRRTSKSNGTDNVASAISNNNNVNNAVYSDDGNIVNPNSQRGGRIQPGGNSLGWPGNNGLRSPALSNVSSGRFGSDDGGLAALNMNPAAFGLGIPSPGMAGLGGMNNISQLMAAQQLGQLTPLQLQQLQMSMNVMNMNGMNMGLQETQMQALLAAQMAAANGFMQPGLSPFQMNNLGQNSILNAMGGRGGGARTSSRAGGSNAGRDRSNNGRENSGKDKKYGIYPSLLNDVPAWLRSLRLHKYTLNFDGMTWRDMVIMDEGALEAKGVAALGARRKMLKTFEVVRKKMGVEMPNAGSGSAEGSNGTGAEGGAGANNGEDA